MTKHSTADRFPVVAWDLIARLMQHEAWPLLSGCALRVLLFLIRCTNHRRPQGSAYPAVRTIAIAVGNARSTVQTALADLEQYGLIERHSARRSQSRLRRGVVRWTVCLPPPPPQHASSLTPEHEQLLAAIEPEQLQREGWPRSARLHHDRQRRRFDRPGKQGH